MELIKVERGLRGVYGPLIELFECPEQLSTAVEVTAGSALFNVVVANDEVYIPREGNSMLFTMFSLSQKHFRLQPN